MAGMASDSALVPVAERERFEQDGYLIIRGALTHDEVLYYRQALDRAYLSAEAESRVAPGGSLHWLSAVAHYTYRWIAIRDENDGIWATDWASQLSPVQRQLLGGLQPGDGDHAWGHFPATTPLYGWLRERDLLDPAYPQIRP
jgi:hypothetical protein